MSRLSAQQVADLGRLALERTEHSISSVTQLMEGPQAYAVMLAVACALIEGATEMLQQGMEEQNGRKLNAADAKNRVVGDVLDGLGVKWKCSSSRTQSARK